MDATTATQAVHTFWDNPGIQQFIGNLPLFVMGLIGLAMVLKRAKNAKFKKGDTEISFDAQQELIKPVVKVVTEYADWKAEYQKEYVKDFDSIHKEAKHFAITAVQGHLSRVNQIYTEQVLNKSKQPKKVYSTKHFMQLFTACLSQDLLNITLTIYDQNHLHGRDEEFLKELINRRYDDIRNVYRSNVQRYWFGDLLPNEEFLTCLNKYEPEFRDMLKKVIYYFKDLSDRKFELNQKYSELDVSVKNSVLEDYRLPVDAYTRLHDLYNPVI